jgi:predicted dehydrogenase
VDAVVIGTPDHWHARMVVDALRAGKDVYVEKPLAHTIEEGRSIVRAAKETGRVVQVGLQQRSGPHYQRAKREYFDSGRMGKVGYVRTWWNGNASRLLDPAQNRRPEGLDWEAWQGPARRRPFQARYFYQWRQYAAYGEGMVGDLFTHWVDVVHWYMGEDLPKAATAMGGIHHFPDGRDWPDHVHLLLEYPGGWHCSYEGSIAPGARGAGIEFNGTGGRLLIDRGQYTFTPAEQNATPETVRFTGDQTVEHVQNFLASVRARSAPNSDALSGHRSTLAAHLGNLAYLRRRRVELDARAEAGLA